MAYLGQENDFVKPSYFLTLFEAFLDTHWVHYLHEMSFLNFPVVFLLPKSFTNLHAAQDWHI